MHEEVNQSKPRPANTGRVKCRKAAESTHDSAASKYFFSATFVSPKLGLTLLNCRLSTGCSCRFRSGWLFYDLQTGNCNSRDSDSRVFLTMARVASRRMPTAQLLNLQLDPLQLSHHNFRRDRSTFNHRSPNHAGSATIREQDLVECQELTILSLASQIDSQDVSLADLVLATSIFKYGEHTNHTLNQNPGESSQFIVPVRCRIIFPTDGSGRIHDYPFDFEPAAERILTSLPRSLVQWNCKCSGPTPLIALTLIVTL